MDWEVIFPTIMITNHFDNKLQILNAVDKLDGLELTILLTLHAGEAGLYTSTANT